MTAHAQQRHSSSPADLALSVRDLRFRPDKPASSEGDPVARAWFVALSATFPRGEAMFIEAVKAHRDGTPPVLAAQIRDFIRQEVNHSREHLAFNRLAAEAGYDLTAIDARVAALVGDAMAQPKIVVLAVTTALEHFTAVFAHEFLTRPEAFLEGAIGGPELWLWHSVEEIEHKGVAYDTWLHATREWSGARRWRVRSQVMLGVTWRFLSNRYRDAQELLAQEGITGWRAHLGQLRYLFGRPGILRRTCPAWLAFFRPGFHPWDHDDRALIARWEAEFAQLPAEAAE
jgi:predicted metal-dependent hydrolase